MPPQSSPGLFAQRIRQAVERAPISSEDGLLSLSLNVPELPFHGLPELENDWFYWARPAEDHYLLGLGIAHEFTATGPERFFRLRDNVLSHRDSWLHLDPEATGAVPKWFVGVAFDPLDPMKGGWQGLPNSGLFLPELLLERRKGRSQMIFSAPFSALHTLVDRWSELADTLQRRLLAPPTRSGRRTRLERISEHPLPTRWLTQVEQAIESITQGNIQKVVPARSVVVQAERDLNPSRLMAVLDCLYPSCQLLGMSVKGRTLVAATPECLVRVGQSRLCSDAIAGTADRAAADDADERLGQQLLTDPKSQREHALVVEAISATLQQYGIQVDTPGEPRLLRLRGLQHLQTRIEAPIKPSSHHILELANAIHPTPAVNGHPAEAALNWLRNHEELARGWFSGCGGWIDNQGEGELDVLLRCALLHEDQAQLFAGSGILADSVPEDELRETELKLNTMLEALENA